MVEEKLNAITMINIDNRMISDDIGFNKKVIYMFSERTIGIYILNIKSSTYNLYIIKINFWFCII